MSDPNQQSLPDAGVVLAAGSALAEHRVVGDVPYVVVPDAYRVETLEHLLPEPRTIKQTVRALSLAALLDYLGAYKDTASPAVFANLTTRTIEGVLDYHRPAAASWCSHRATYQCPLSLEWQAWQGADKRAMSIQDFAEHIERNLPDIVEPDAATMLEISQGLTGKVDAKFTASTRLADGSFALRYEEDVSAHSAKGDRQVPSVFAIGIPPFLGAEPFRIEARLRYRIKDGKLTIGYELVRPERVLATKFSEILDAVRAAGFAVYEAVRE